MPFVPVYRHASFRLLALRFVLLAAMALLSASAVSASTITYSLIPGPGGPGTFELTAQTSIGDNFGLDYYAVTIAGAATIQHASVSPTLSDLDSGLNYGFSFARSADNVAVVSAAQDSVGGGVPVYGMGQTAGTLKSQLPAGNAFAPGRSDSIGAYGAPVVLATGTYLDNVPPTVVTNAIAGFVFTSQGTGGAFGSFAAPSNFVINQFDGSSTSIPDPLAPSVNPPPTVPTTPEAPPVVTPPLATAPPIDSPPTVAIDDPQIPPVTGDPQPAIQPIIDFVPPLIESFYYDGNWVSVPVRGAPTKVEHDGLVDYTSQSIDSTVYGISDQVVPMRLHGGLQAAMITALAGLHSAESFVSDGTNQLDLVPGLRFAGLSASVADLAERISFESAVPTPEPATLALFGLAFIGMCGIVRRRRSG